MIDKMAIVEGIEASADTIRNRTHIADGIEESNVGQRSAHIMRRKRLQMKMHKQ